jgi:AraC-like DNA-binding protein
LSLVDLAYGARVVVDAGEFPDLYLFMRCTGGEGVVYQGAGQSAWHPGTTVPVSAWHRTRFDFSPGFEQSTFRPGTEALEACCGRLLGRPLDEKLCFDLVPFTAEFERTWTGVLGLLGTLPLVLPDLARRALEEFVLASLLTGHRHNYTDWLLCREQVSRPARLVSRAEAIIQHRIDDTTLTASSIAQSLGVSMRALQYAFQEHRGLTPTAYLRQLRLEQVRKCLLAGKDGDKVIDVALAHGFFHLGRFAQQYKAHFGEAPSDTLRSRRRSSSRSVIAPA